MCLVCVVALTACGSSSRSILYSGTWSTGQRHLITDAEARRDGRLNQADWIQQVAIHGIGHRRAQFSNLSTAEFRRRLAVAATKYDFTVEKVRFLKPKPSQLAPLVVVRTTKYLAFSQAIGAIERSVDPGRSHPAFEAIYLEGQDERGIPFVIVENEWRGQRYGGQWARSEALFPGPHG